MMNFLELLTRQLFWLLLVGFREYLSFDIYLDPFRSIRHKALLFYRYILMVSYISAGALRC